MDNPVNRQNFIRNSVLPSTVATTAAANATEKTTVKGHSNGMATRKIVRINKKG